MALTGSPILIGQAEYVSSSTQLHQLGSRAYDENGRVYRYAKAGETLVAGNALQSPIWPTDHYNLSVYANAAIGDKIVYVTNGGSTAITAGMYAGGYLIVSTTPGEGYTYLISNNTAAGTGATCTVTLKVPLVVALTAAGSKVELTYNSFNGVIQSPATTLTAGVAGVATYIITSGQYGWVGWNGTFGTLIAGTPAMGQLVSLPGTTGGAVVINSGTLLHVGFMRALGVDGKIKPVQWTLG